MSRKILSVLLAAFLAVGFASFVTRADVTGSFGLRIEIEPIDCGALSFIGVFSVPPGPNGPGTPAPSPVICEKTLTKQDWETSLNVNWTISGLTLGFASHAGFNGIEDLVTSLSATLGALNILDQFVFAMPYGSDTLIIVNNGQTHSQKVFTLIPQTTGKADAKLLFVKKRVTMNISIAGITLSNLAVFEDVNFPSPSKAEPSCYAGVGCAGQQAFGFGDTITVSGQTVSGITVTNITGISMDPQKTNKTKKLSFPGLVCQANGPLGFGVEKIQVQGIPVGPVTVDEFLKFVLQGVGNGSPNCGATAPFDAVTDITFNSAIGVITAELETTDITKSFLNSASLTLSSGGVTVIENFNGSFQLSSLEATLSATLNPDSNPASLSVDLQVCQNAADCTLGLNKLTIGLGVKRSGVSFSTSAVFNGVGTINLSSLSFKVTATAGAVNLGANITLKPNTANPWVGIFTAGINF